MKESPAASRSKLRQVSHSFQGAISSLMKAPAPGKPLTLEEFYQHVGPYDLRIKIERFEKKWLGESVSLSSNPNQSNL